MSDTENSIREVLPGPNLDLNLGMPFTTLTNDTFEALFNYASIGILITNATGDIQMANKYIEKQFCYNEGELIGKKVEVLIPSRYSERHVHHRNRFSSDPHSRPMGLGMELAGQKKDGSEFPVEVSLGHYKIGDDSYALAFINDITQRKETEQAIIQLNAHLEEKVKEGSQSLALTVEQLGSQIKETERKDAELERVNTFLNNIWNHAGAIIFVCDNAGTVQFFNPAAEKSLGYSAAEVVGIMTLANFHLQTDLEKKAETLSKLTGRNVNADFELFTVATEQGLGNNMEWNYVRKDGSTFYVSLNVTPLRDAQNNISSYLGIAIDISEKRKAETELVAALQKEKELNELKSRFVSMASHEFRTPLSAVLSSAYLLSKYVKAEDQPQREKHIQRIVSSVTSLTEILNDFLSVGKIEEGEVHINLREYDIKLQLEESIQEVTHLLKHKQTISYNHSGSNIAFLDQSKMRHIITNLLSNAIKFSNEDSVIEVTTAQDKDALVFSVKDQGIGIPAEDMQSLFNRFFRSSNVTNIQGTGLGLHIVSKYAELLNGKVTCESTLGSGTKFTIRFSNQNSAQ
jgi:PAS domain S-box-containing protein